MNTNASAPIAISNEIPSFDLSPNVRRIAFDEEALVVASQLADEFRVEAAQRDRERRLPADERRGLLAGRRQSAPSRRDLRRHMARCRDFANARGAVRAADSTEGPKA
jgi:hypothetical protein